MPLGYNDSTYKAKLLATKSEPLFKKWTQPQKQEKNQWSFNCILTKGKLNFEEKFQHDKDAYFRFSKCVKWP